ncbi:hypothetical protein FRC08_011007 [Ceratobasidium sp. 394]|nr:hypothetical protein FRC08_011007 [Ceratobasidium sp. 394]
MTNYNYSGGGNVDNIELDRGAESLVWMMNEAEQAGLKFDPRNLGQDVKRARVIPSMTTSWWILEFFPLTRLNSSGVSTTKKPHLGRGRRIPNHHKIHYSVLANRQQAEDGEYEPHAKFKTQAWASLFQAPRERKVWDGDYKLVNALKIIREVDGELTKAAEETSEGEPWLSSVAEHLQDGRWLLFDLSRQYRYGNFIASDASAKMVWEHGGLRFLLKIAKFNDASRVRDIVRAVLGTHPGGSTRAPTHGFKTEVVLEGIPRLRDLLLCYGEIGPDINVSPEEPKRRGWLGRQTRERSSIPDTHEASHQGSEEKRDQITHGKRITKEPAGPILVRVALDIVKDLTDQGEFGDKVIIVREHLPGTKVIPKI